MSDKVENKTSTMDNKNVDSTVKNSPKVEKKEENTKSSGGRKPRFGERAASGARFSERKNRVFKRNTKGGRNRNERGRRRTEKEESPYENQVIEVRRVTRVAKGGKKMRFSAMVVVGDRKGQVGYAIKKGVDFQSAVNKAVKKASQNMVTLPLNEDSSLPFTMETKFKAARIFLKPAKVGTGLIAGGYLRPVLELAGVQNIYSKIIGGTNKISGVQAVFKALENYAKLTPKKVEKTTKEIK